MIKNIFQRLEIDPKLTKEEAIESALRQLGFVSSNKVQFKGWIEAKDLSAVVPQKAITEDCVFNMNLSYDTGFFNTDWGSKGAGFFHAEWGSIGPRKLMLLDAFLSTDILKASKQIVEARRKVTQALLDYKLVVDFDDYNSQGVENIYRRKSDGVKHELHFLKMDVTLVVHSDIKLWALLKEVCEVDTFSRFNHLSQ